MKLVKMVRSSPEVPGGPTSCKVQLQDIDALKARGYVQEGDEFEIADPETDATKTDAKAALVAKALELELGNEEELNAMSVEDLQKLVAEKSEVSPEKSELVAKLLALKEAHPKIVKAAPSQITAMSVKALNKIINAAEADIAAGKQE